LLHPFQKSIGCLAVQRERNPEGEDYESTDDVLAAEKQTKHSS